MSFPLFGGRQNENWWFVSEDEENSIKQEEAHEQVLSMTWFLVLLTSLWALISSQNVFMEQLVVSQHQGLARPLPSFLDSRHMPTSSRRLFLQVSGGKLWVLCGFRGSPHLIATTSDWGCRLRKVSRKEMISLPTPFPKWQQWILPIWELFCFPVKSQLLGTAPVSAWSESWLFNFPDNVTIFFFKLAKIFRKRGSSFHPWVKVNYSVLTTTNCLTLLGQLVGFEKKNQYLLQKGIPAKIYV